MVGGRIIGLARGSESTLVHVRESTHSNDECSIRVVEKRRDNGEPVVLGIGDQIWWQSRDAMWAPKEMDGHSHEGCGMTWDIILPRIGYSH